jgi:hypothetical protein
MLPKKLTENGGILDGVPKRFYLNIAGVTLIFTETC